MNIKTSISCILVLAMLLLLTACGAAPAAAEPAAPPAAETVTEPAAEPETEPAAEEEDVPFVQMVNPVSEVTFDEMVQTTGVTLGIPGGAEDVRCFVIGNDPAIAQVFFRKDGRAYTLRGVDAMLDATRLSGVYFGSPSESNVEVAGAEAALLSEGSTAVLYLTDADSDLTYTLSCEECEDPALLPQIAAEIFTPGEDGPDDMIGTFADENFDDVTLAEAGDGSITAIVGIYRLSTFEGTGAMNEGTMELTLVDPNGGDLYATFAPAGDGTYTLTFTHSTWPLLESGTVLEGFSRDSVG